MIHIDSPLDDIEKDELARENFVRGIELLIKNYESQKSLVIGVYGKWGEGKTTTINFLRNQLKDSKFIQLTFNPWRIQDEDKLLQSYFNDIIGALENGRYRNQKKIGDLLKEYSAVLGVVGGVIGASSLKELSEQAGSALSWKNLEGMKKVLDKAFEKSQKRFIIYLDDIDRLNSREIQVLFKIVKLIGNFSNTVYILAFDSWQVARALDPEFSNAGTEYLEKIVNVPLDLPKVSDQRLHKYSLDILNKSVGEGEDNDFRRFREAYDRILFKYVTSPRTSKKIANACAIARPMLSDITNLDDMLVVETVRVLNPELFHFIKFNSSLLLKSYTGSTHLQNYSEIESAKEHARDQIQKLANQNHFTYSDILELLKLLFPQIRNLTELIDFGDSWKEWYNQKRICSKDYFDKYFTYALEDGEISDIYFDSLIDNLVKQEYKDTPEILLSILSEVDADALHFKLIMSESRFTDEEKVAIAKGVSLVGEFFPDKEGDIHSPRSSMISFIRRAITNSPSKALNVAKDIVISRAQSWEFATHILLKLFPEVESEKFAIEDYENLKKDFFRKRLKPIQIKQIIESHHALCWFTLQLFGEYESLKTKETFANLLKTEPELVIERLLDILSPTSYKVSLSGENEDPEPQKEALRLGGYETLQSIVDVDLFFEKSKELYGDQWDNLPDSHQRSSLNFEQLVGSFQSLHLEHKEEKS